MNFLKNMGNRLIYFIAGVVLTVLGGYLVYLDFKINRHHSSFFSHFSSYPFIMLVLGIGCIAVALSKSIDEKKEEEKPVQKAEGL